MTSRQREHQLEKREKGICQNCTQSLNLYKLLCDSCAEKARIRARKRKGFKAHIEGGRGRPPRGLDYHDY